MEVGTGKETGLETGRAQHRLDHRRNAAFALAAGYVDGYGAKMGVAELAQEKTHRRDIWPVRETPAALEIRKGVEVAQRLDVIHGGRLRAINRRWQSDRKSVSDIVAAHRARPLQSKENAMNGQNPG